MEDYINDSLAEGIIRHSTSPVGVGFFYVEKKDNSLGPCIDFQGLNNITVKNKYATHQLLLEDGVQHTTRAF